MTFFKKFAVVSLLSMSMAHAATLPGGRYGDVAFAKPTGPMRGFVVLFSDKNWTPADQQAADALAKNGAMVVGVDTARYAAKLPGEKESCHNLVGDAEAVSHQLEREVQSSRYFAPILMGTGQGGVLATKILAQAPDNTVAGALALNPDLQLDARFNLCPPDPTITHAKGLPGFFDKTTQPAAASKADALLALATPHLKVEQTRDEDVSDLPLIELPAAHPTNLLAIVISGDGGWRDLDKTVAESLQKDGVSVIGIDSLRYFWSAKTPEQTSHDLTRVIQAYSARWHSEHIALIGYSFGADEGVVGIADGLFARRRFPDSRNGLARHACEQGCVESAAGTREIAARDRPVHLRRGRGRYAVSGADEDGHRSGQDRRRSPLWRRLQRARTTDFGQLAEADCRADLTDLSRASGCF
jgi:type IV secretory pathway VirJ component